MRRLVVAGLAGILMAMGQADSAKAQTPQTAYEEGSKASPRLSFAEQAIHERSATEARERRERIESHKWAGHIPLRPVIYVRPSFYDIRRGPWDHYYGGDFYFRHYPGWYRPVRVW